MERCEWAWSCRGYHGDKVVVTTVLEVEIYVVNVCRKPAMESLQNLMCNNHFSRVNTLLV